MELGWILEESLLESNLKVSGAAQGRQLLNQNSQKEILSKFSLTIDKKIFFWEIFSLQSLQLLKAILKQNKNLN